MFEVGQKVLYGAHGVCTVMGIESMRFGAKRERFYVLEPDAQPGTRFYVPVDNGAATAKMRPLLSREELLAMLHSDEVRNYPWIPDDNQRKLRFRELIVSGNRAEVMGMVAALHWHRREQLASGRKFHIADENFLNDAEKVLHAEFACVFGLEPGQVRAFILRELENTH